MKSFKISKPLEEDPSDLVNIHPPTLEELGMESFESLPRWNWWTNGILQSDGITCAFFTEFNCWKKFWFIEMGLISGDTGLRVLEGGKGKEYLVDQLGGKIEFSSLEGDVKFTVRKDGHNLFVDRMFGKDKVHLSLKFNDLKMPFWYNKGRVATFFPDGQQIFGIEQISHASGHGTLNGEKVNLEGFANHEHVFSNKGDIEGFLKYGGEFWMPFLCDKIRGIFVVFHDYRDAGLIIDDEYLIPKNFEIRSIRWLNQVPIDVSVSAETYLGTLNLTYRGIGVIRRQVPTRVNLTLRRKDGRVTRLNGLGWIEHIA